MANFMGSMDTNLLARWLVNDVPEQTKKVDRLIESGATLHVSDAALIELVFVLQKHYQCSRKNVANIFSNLFDTKNLNFNRGLIRRALKVFVGNPQLSFEDCYLAESAMTNDALPLWTFDKTFAKKSEFAQELL